MAYQYQNSGFGRFSLFPPILKALLIVNVAVFLLQYLFLDRFTLNGIKFEAFFTLQPLDTIYQGPSIWYFMPWQLITYQFLHGGLMHLFFNMLALWMFGSELETLWGSTKFLIYYLLSGIGAGLAQLFVAPMFSQAAPAIGASGSIYGILLAFALTFPNRPIFMFPFFFPIPAKIFVLIFAGIEMFSGISGSDGIAHFAHLGGAATGFILIKFGDKLGLYEKLIKLFSSRTSPKAGSSYTQKPEKTRVFKINNWASKSKSEFSDDEYYKEKSNFSIDGEEITQVKIDAILDKISSTGYQNLTEREKKILYELSQKLK